MPPPPVAGATVGSGLADRVGVADARAVCVTVTVGAGDTDPVGLVLALGELLMVSLAETVGVGEALPPGENDADGPAEGVDPEHAETAAEASMAMMLQPMTANLALSHAPAMVARSLMEPPHASRQVAPPFPGPGTANQYRKEKRVATRPPKAPAEDTSQKRRRP